MNKKKIAFCVIMLIVVVLESIFWFSWNLETASHMIIGATACLSVVGIVSEFRNRSDDEDGDDDGVLVDEPR
jgi:hypothetical protein